MVDSFQTNTIQGKKQHKYPISKISLIMIVKLITLSTIIFEQVRVHYYLFIDSLCISVLLVPQNKKNNRGLLKEWSPVMYMEQF